MWYNKTDRKTLLTNCSPDQNHFYTGETTMAKTQLYHTSEIEFHPIPTHGLFLNLNGQTFGYWTVLGFAGRMRSYLRYHWLCRCHCGVTQYISAGDLRSGHSKSCGCERGNLVSKAKWVFGAATNVEYRAFNHAKTRCTNPKVIGFSRYGGRGIEFRFKTFQEFLQEVGNKPSPQHSIDRIDNNGHYEKGNVRWATKKEQARNTRRNRMLSFNGETLCIAEWSEKLGISQDAISSHLLRDNGIAEIVALLLRRERSAVLHLQENK